MFIYSEDRLRKSERGRKREKKLTWGTIYAFLYDEILPTWDKKLGNLSQREREVGQHQRGESYVWKQFLIDVQNFYRIVFKHRFHRLDKRNDENQEILASTILKELGIDYKGDLKKAFHYFYPVLFKLRKMSGK